MTVREQVFDRDDNRCRIPWCQGWGFGSALQWAHLKARGMGGNPDGSRDSTENTIVACQEHHTGRHSLHSGHIKYQFLTERGADGPMAFAYCERLPIAECGVALEDVTL